MPHRSRGQMLCCDCSLSCCIFNDALLFCINLESVKAKTRPAPLHEAARVLSNRERATVFLFTFFSIFSNKSAADTHGNTECLALRPTSSLVSDPSGGAFTRFLSAKHYATLMDSTEGRRQGLPDPPPLLNPSVSTHELLFCHHAGSHTHSHTWCLASPVVFLGPSLHCSHLTSVVKDAACHHCHRVLD